MSIELSPNRIEGFYVADFFHALPAFRAEWAWMHPINERLEQYYNDLDEIIEQRELQETVELATRNMRLIQENARKAVCCDPELRQLPINKYLQAESRRVAEYTTDLLAPLCYGLLQKGYDLSTINSGGPKLS